MKFFLGFFFLILSVACTSRNTKIQSAKTDREGIKNVIKENRDAIKKCYQTHASDEDKKNQKKIRMQWRIVEGGKAIILPPAVNQFSNNAVANCIGEILKNETFPDPPEGTTGKVSFPFIFGPKTNPAQ